MGGFWGDAAMGARQVCTVVCSKWVECDSWAKVAAAVGEGEGSISGFQNLPTMHGFHHCRPSSRILTLMQTSVDTQGPHISRSSTETDP